MGLGQRKKNDEDGVLFVFDVIKDKVLRQHILVRISLVLTSSRVHVYVNMHWFVIVLSTS